MPVARDNWIPMVSNGLEVDPGLFSPAVILGQPDEAIFALYGQEKNTGGIGAPMFPTNGIPLLAAALGGTDVVTGASPGPYTHTIGQRGTGQPPSLTVEKIIGGTQSLLLAGAKVSKYTLKGQATDTEASFTADVVAQSWTLGTASGSGVGANTVIDVLSDGVTLPAATINVGSTTGFAAAGYAYVMSTTGVQTVAYTGVTSTSLTGCTGGTGTIHTGYYVSSAALIGTPSIVNEEPYVFSEFTLEWAGQTLAQSGNFTVNIDTGVKPTYTFNGSHEPQFLPATMIKVDGSFDVVWDSLDNEDGLGFDFFDQIIGMQTGVAGPQLSFKVSHPLTGYSVQLVMPNCWLAKSARPVKLGEVVMETLDFRAFRPPGASYTVQAVVVNGRSTAY